MELCLGWQVTVWGSRPKPTNGKPRRKRGRRMRRCTALWQRWRRAAAAAALLSLWRIHRRSSSSSKRGCLYERHPIAHNDFRTRPNRSEEARSHVQPGSRETESVCVKGAHHQSKGHGYTHTLSWFFPGCVCQTRVGTQQTKASQNRTTFLS